MLTYLLIFAPLFAASTSNPQYFEFAGRMVALALMHKVAIGVRLDQVLVLQLAERCVSLEDIRDADPTSYRNYKYILEWTTSIWSLSV